MGGVTTKADLTPAEKICKFDFMKLRISATETARRFSELMNRVRYRGESFVVERGGKPICEILPAQPPKFSGCLSFHQHPLNDLPL